MNAKSEAQGSTLDTVKLSLSVVFLVAGVIGFYLFEEQALWVRLLGLLTVVALAIFIAVQTAIGRQIRYFMSAAHTEVRKVVWPTRQETLQTTVAVLFMVILVAIMLWLFDMLLGWGVSKLLA